MHCANIIINRDIIFIHWENSRIDDPVFDIVSFFYESENLQNLTTSITEEQKKIFLEEYQKIKHDAFLKERLEIVYPLRWLSDTLWLASRISDYENIQKDRSKEEYQRLYEFNLRRLKDLFSPI